MDSRPVWGPTVRGPVVRFLEVDNWAPDSWAPGPTVRGPTVRGPIHRGPICLETSVVIVGPSKLLQLSVVLMPTDFGLHCLSVCLLGGERERTPLVATRKLQDWPKEIPTILKD